VEEVSLVKEFITIYGPLSLGWVAAGYLAKRNTEMQTMIMNAFLQDTQAKVEMKAAFEKLSLIVDKSHG